MEDRHLILLFVDPDCTDEDLFFMENYVPDLLIERMSVAGFDCLISVPEEYRGRLSSHDRCHVRKAQDDVTFWKGLFATNDAVAIAKINADAPFLDASIVRDMMNLHLSSMAEFTFAENLPQGCTCEIVSRELIGAIPSMETPTLPLGQVVRSNLNGFDAEIYYRDPDIRHLRMSFLNRDPRNRRVMEQIYNVKNAFPSYDELHGIIDGNPSFLAIGPSYLELEPTGRCDLDCIFCYRKTLGNVHPDMSMDLVKKIIAEMKTFGLPYTLCLGGSGEPLMHPSFYAVLESFLAESPVERIIVETNGILSDDQYVSFVQRKGAGRVQTVVNINGCDAETYRGVHGYDGFERVSTNVMKMKEAGIPLYLQIMKIKETESFLDRYYDFWEGRGLSIILQKQNTYLGKISDRRYSDLTPVERGHCWHLARDLYILSDGSVAFCKQDVAGEMQAGNVLSQSLEDLWNNRKDAFVLNYQCRYPEKPDCRSCDEWYTFNF